MIRIIAQFTRRSNIKTTINRLVQGFGNLTTLSLIMRNSWYTWNSFWHMPKKNIVTPTTKDFIGKWLKWKSEIFVFVFLSGLPKQRGKGNRSTLQVKTTEWASRSKPSGYKFSSRSWTCQTRTKPSGYKFSSRSWTCQTRTKPSGYKFSSRSWTCQTRTKPSGYKFSSRSWTCQTRTKPSGYKFSSRSWTCQTRTTKNLWT